MKKRVRLLISGVVQGVFYRANAARVARTAYLVGFVKNLSDGRVEVLAEGEEERVREFVKWCSTGPSQAQVSHVEIEWFESENALHAFEIR